MLGRVDERVGLGVEDVGVEREVGRVGLKEVVVLERLGELSSSR